MTSERRQRLEEIFFAALEAPDSERADLVRARCGEDEDLRREVLDLLDCASEDQPLLRTAAAAEHAEWFTDGPRSDHPEALEDIGPYHIVRRLGEGGMGIVWLAEQTSPLVRPVALKVLKLGLDSREFLARFDGERRALARMSHSGIAKIFDTGVTREGRPFFAMEYVEGAPITDYCDERGLSIRERIELFLQVCDAVQHAHQKGVIHRDLKPTNILVQDEVGRPVAKVIDFGVAKAIDRPGEESETFTLYGRLIGTPEYMSPEQADLGDPTGLDTRTDIYSLGLVLYQLLVGALPFEAQALRRKGLDDLLRAIRDTDAPRLSTRLRGLSAEEIEEAARRRAVSRESLGRQLRGDLEWIVAKTLEKDRARRYASASELSADLSRFLAEETVLATPPTAVYRMSRFVRRNRTTVAAVITVFLGLTVSLAIALTEYRASEEARGRAVSALAEKDRALGERDEAFLREQRARRRSEGLRRSAQAWTAAPENPEVALLLALEGAELHPGLHADEALLEVLKSLVPFVELGPLDSMAVAVRWSADGALLATVTDEQGTSIWRTDDWRLLRHLPGRGFGSEFSPDGKLFATHVRGRGLCIWDLELGEPRRVLDTVPLAFSVDFDRSGDRVLLAIAATRRAEIWSVESGERLVVFQGHDDRVIAAALDPSETRVVTASTDGTARVWDAATGAQLHVLEVGSEVRSIAFSPDGRLVAASGRLGRARLFDTRTGELLQTQVVGGGELRAVAFAHDGQRWAAASMGREAHVWSVASGKAVAVLRGHRAHVEDVAFQPGGELVATGAFDKVARLWSLENGDARLELVGHGERIYDLEFRPDGARLATASSDKTARVWSTRNALDELRLDGHTGRVYSAAFDSTARSVVTTSLDHTARVWRLSGYEPPRLTAILSGHGERIYDAVVLADEERCMTCSSDTTVRVWSLASGEQTAILRGHRAIVTRLVRRADGRFVASVSEDRTARLWDVERLAEHAVLEHGARVDDAAFDATGERLVTACRDGIVRAWRVTDGALIGAFEGHRSHVNAVRWLRDGRIVSAGRDGTVRIWPSPDPQRPESPPLEGIRLEGHRAPVVCLAVIADGRLLASGSEDETVRLWSTSTGELLRTLAGHEGAVVALAATPDGRQLTSASADATARVWSLADGTLRMTLRAHTDRLLSVDVDPTGRWVVTSSEDGSARLWPLDVVAFAGRFRRRDLTPDERRLWEVELPRGNADTLPGAR